MGVRLEVGHDAEKVDDQYRACRQLWAHVLLRAVSDAVRLAAAKRPVWLQMSHEAIEWIKCELSTPGSFRWICSHLDIDPERVRARVDEMVCQSIKSDGRGLPRFLQDFPSL